MLCLFGIPFGQPVCIAASKHESSVCVCACLCMCVCFRSFWFTDFQSSVQSLSCQRIMASNAPIFCRCLARIVDISSPRLRNHFASVRPASVSISQVSIFVSGPGTTRLLNVHPDCILAVFPADTPLPTPSRLEWLITCGEFESLASMRRHGRISLMAFTFVATCGFVRCSSILERPRDTWNMCASGTRCVRSTMSRRWALGSWFT